MALDTTVFAQDLANITADLPDTYTWNGNAYTCMVGDVGREDRNELAGFGIEQDTPIVGPTSDFTGTWPAPGDQITHSGRTYHIRRVVKSADGVMYTLYLETT